MHGPCASSAPFAAGSLGGTSRRLVKFEGGDEKTLTPDDPTKYTMRFESTGSISVCIDCNRGHGALPGRIKLTLAHDGLPGRYEKAFLQALGQVNTRKIASKQLELLAPHEISLLALRLAPQTNSAGRRESSGEVLMSGR